MKKLIFLIGFILCSCSPEAQVESNLFPPSPANSLSAQSIEDVRLKNNVWFLWNKEDDMSLVMQLSAKKSFLEKIASDLLKQTKEVQLAFDSFMMENMRPDQFENYQRYNRDVATKKQKLASIENSLKEELAKPEEEQDKQKISKLKKKIKNKQEQIGKLLAEIETLLDIYLPTKEQREQMQAYQQTIKEMTLALGGLQIQIKEVVMQIASLVDLNQQAPALVIQSKENGLYIELAGFGMNADTKCASDLGNLFDTKLDLKKGLLEFKVLCQQRQPDLIDVYILQLELTQTKPLTFSGDMLRCTDKAPARGTCLHERRFGIIEFQAAVE